MLDAAHANLHTLDMTCAPAGIECLDCGRRSLVTLETLKPKLPHNMQPLRTLVGRLVCGACGSRVAKVWVPNNMTEAMWWKDGGKTLKAPG